MAALADDESKLRVVIVEGFLAKHTAVGKRLRYYMSTYGRRKCGGCRVVELDCACVDCTAQLARVLGQLARERDDGGEDVDLVIVETAGREDPSVVAEVFLDDAVAAVAYLDGVITSLEIDVEADVDVCLFQGWIDGLHATADLFRVEAEVAVKDVPDRYAYRATRRPSAGDYGAPWGDEARRCRVRVVGKDLDHGRLRETFEACLATRANYRRIVKRFRFRLGDAVECFLGGDQAWGRGTIVKHLYQDPCWHYPPGFLAPYQIELDDGRLIYCPADNAGLIRKAACRRAGSVRVCSARRRHRAQS